MSRKNLPEWNSSSLQGVKEFPCIAIIAIDATIAAELFKAQASGREKPTPYLSYKPPIRNIWAIWSDRKVVLHDKLVVTPYF